MGRQGGLNPVAGGRGSKAQRCEKEGPINCVFLPEIWAVYSERGEIRWVSRYAGGDTKNTRGNQILPTFPCGSSLFSQRKPLSQ